MLRFIPKSLLPMYGMVFMFSMFINILSLFSMWHFLLVIDRVIPGRNTATLIFITVAVLIALAVMSMLKGVRTRLLGRLSNRLEGFMSGPVVQSMFSGTSSRQYDQGASDLQKVRSFLGGNSIIAFFDLPWLPIFLAINFILHPLLGIVSCAGAVILLILLAFNEAMTRKASKAFSDSSPESVKILDLAQRNVQTIYSMGMLPDVVSRWKQSSARDLALETRVHHRVGVSAATNKAVSMALGIAILSAGAMLVIDNQITFGMMIVARMIMGRALSPLNAMLGGWKDFQQARFAASRLKDSLQEIEEAAPSEDIKLDAHQDKQGFAVKDLTLVVDSQPVFQDINFTLSPGSVLAVSGPSGAGKTTMLKTLAGLYKPTAGYIYIDGHPMPSLDQQEERASLLGYMPQDVELQAVSIAENIGRLHKENSEMIIEAAKLAGAHEMILKLPRGYDTVILPKAANLSAGQRQRVALARAFYGSPRLLLLDEPDANLDESGRKDLHKAIEQFQNLGSMIVIVSHQTWLDSLDKVISLQMKPFASPGEELTSN